MSWTYISDDADLPWIEEVLGEVIKKDWLQVIWVPERRGAYPLKEFGIIIPRLEFIERKEALEKPCDVEITPFTSDLFDKLPEYYKNWGLPILWSMIFCIFHAGGNGDVNAHKKKIA